MNGNLATLDWGSVFVFLTSGLGVLFTVLKIMDIFKGDSRRKKEEDLDNVKINNEQDRRIDVLDHRLTTVEHNMGRLEGLIQSMDSRVSDRLTELNTKFDMQSKEILAQIIELTKAQNK